MTKEPVCLVQWLDPGEYAETLRAWKDYRWKINVQCWQAASKAEVIGRITEWLADNDNSQVLYIGSHGNESELGPNSVPGGAGLSWAELASLLGKAVWAPVLMLGACHSSAVARAWSPIRSSLPAAWITAFPESEPPNVIEPVLLQMLGDLQLDPVVFMDKELARLRKEVTTGKVEQFYPASTKDKTLEYVNVDEFPERVGATLREVLTGNARRPGIRNTSR